MEPPVVPDGEVSRAGAERDRAVSLNDVEHARRASVLAYCARLCDPARIAEAADAAFAELGEQLEALSADRVVDLDRMLLEATRDAAAARVDVSSGAPRLGSRRSTRTCELMPTLLAARASARLSASDRAGVERHITRCADCRELQRRRDEAEQAYEALLGQPVAPAPPSEPFAPDDPEPEVAVARGVAAAVPIEAAAEPEPEPEPDDGVFEPEPAPEAEIHDEPAPEAEIDDEPADSEPGPFVVAAEEPEPEPIAADAEREPEHEALDGNTQPFTPAEERDATGSRRPRRTLLIAALFIAGVVILAVGLLQLGGDEDGGTTAQQTDQRAAQTAAPAPAPAARAEPAASRAELRTRARLRALGDRELGPGTVGNDVKALQRLLGVQQTGNYGDLTAFAVGQFQARHALPATGIADEATKRRLARRPRPPRQAPTEPQGEQQPPPAATPEGTPPPAGQAAPPSAPGATGR